MSSQTQQSPSIPPLSETNSVNLSALIKHYIDSLHSPEGWRVLAIDPLNDVVVLIREVKTQ